MRSMLPIIRLHGDRDPDSTDCHPFAMANASYGSLFFPATSPPAYDIFFHRHLVASRIVLFDLLLASYASGTYMRCCLWLKCI